MNSVVLVIGGNRTAVYDLQCFAAMGDMGRALVDYVFDIREIAAEPTCYCKTS